MCYSIQQNQDIMLLYRSLSLRLYLNLSHSANAYFFLYEYYSFFSFSPFQGLPIIDDGNGHSYFCALRLLIGSHASDQHKVFPQSARTRCVKPVETTGLLTHCAKWNEHFIFEVPEQVPVHLCPFHLFLFSPYRCSMF